MKKILVIDDSQFMRLALIKIFPENKYEFIETADGKEGLNLYAKAKPDLIFLDIVMPELRGVEVLKTIRKKDRNVKIIMITAVGRDTVIDECKKLGVLEYITKPFDESQVRELVEKSIG